MKIATVKLYLTAPRVQGAAGSDLPSLLVAVRAPCYRGLGIVVDVSVDKSCKSRNNYADYYRRCSCRRCRVLTAAHFEAARIRQRAVDKYQLIDNGGYLHVFRAPPRRADAARARLVRNYLVNQFQRSGFEVRFVGDDGREAVRERK